MANVVWDMKSIRGVVRQLLGDILWGLAIKGKTSVPVMVIEEPAEPFLAHFKAKVIAGGYSACAGKAFNDCDYASYPLGGDFPVHCYHHLTSLVRSLWPLAPGLHGFYF